MVPYYSRRHRTTSDVTIYDSTDATTSTGDYDYFYFDEYVSLSGNTGVHDGDCSSPGISGIVGGGRHPRFIRNKINIKLKKQILPVKPQMRFTVRNAL